MADPQDLDQWSSVKSLLHGYPSWVGDPDRTRIAAYQTYEEIYWSEPQAFKLIQRGDDANPIYIPAAKVIVETLQRYLANDLTIAPDPDAGTTAEQQAAQLFLTSLFARERFFSTFTAAKRFGIIRGDWIFYLYADPALPEGSRITIKSIDPAAYFPIWSDDNMDSVIGCHIVEQIIIGDKPFIDRSTYRKVTEKGGPSPITFERAVFKSDEWGGPGIDEGPVQRMVVPAYQLPDPIDQLPTYHIRHGAVQPGADWGSSELRGIERLLAAINQSISDEDLALVLEGLGVYATNAGSPVDPDTKQPTDWNLGPGRVVELPAGKDSSFQRVTGVASVEPMQGHLRYLHEQLDLAAASPDVAKGKVDSTVAESGISLLLQMGPLLAHVAEGEQPITDVLTNMLFDLRNWFAAYEGQNFENVRWLPYFGDKIPLNRKERFDEIMAMVTATTPVVSGAWARRELSKIGYDFGDDTEMLDEILTEKQSIGQVQADFFGSQMDSEMAALEAASNGSA